MIEMAGMFRRRWDEITHASKKAYSFRLNYIMRPLQKMAALTPWFDESVAKAYETKIDRTYLEWLGGAKVLDVGCGPGNLSTTFPLKFGTKAYVGMDLTDPLI